MTGTCGGQMIDSFLPPLRSHLDYSFSGVLVYCWRTSAATLRFSLRTWAENFSELLGRNFVPQGKWLYQVEEEHASGN